MVNIERLRAALQTSGVSIEQASNELGINPTTFYRRLNTQGEKFTVEEVGKLANMLKLNARALQNIFFDR